MILERDQADYDPAAGLDYAGFYVRDPAGDCVGWIRVESDGKVAVYAMLDDSTWEFVTIKNSKEEAVQHFERTAFLLAQTAGFD